MGSSETETQKKTVSIVNDVIKKGHAEVKFKSGNPIIVPKRMTHKIIKKKADLCLNSGRYTATQ